MKKFVVCFVCLLLLLSSCSNTEYSERDPQGIYKPEFCYENYIMADPNLVPVALDDKDFGTIMVDGVRNTFYSMKEIPLEKFLCKKERSIILQEVPEIRVVRNKELIEEPIFDYHFKKTELFWESEDYSESVVEMDPRRFQEDLHEKINAQNYLSHDSPWTSILKKHTDGSMTWNLRLKVRVSFSEYENLAWEANVFLVEEKYYLEFYIYQDNENESPDFYAPILIPLDLDIDLTV